MPHKPQILFSFILFASMIASGQQNDAATRQKEYDDSVKCEKLYDWEENIEYVDYDYVEDTPLSKLETDRDSLHILQFIKGCNELLQIFKSYQGYPGSIVSTVFAIDFNGDSVKDFLYYGPTGGTPLMTKIFINMGDNYKEVFSGLQVITEYEFKENRLASFRLYDPGCCLEAQILNYDYIVHYNKNKPSFIRVKTIGSHVRTQKPDSLAEDSMDFSIVNDSAHLRMVCYMLDETDCPPFHYSGTTIAKYGKGATGKLLGTRKEQRVDWVYVIMDVNPGKMNCYYPSFTEQPTHIKGWMLKSDTDLK